MSTSSSSSLKEQGRKESDESHDLVLEGVPVTFPKKQYDVQETFMSHAIGALRAGTNALLESPTGTGKTLCLLCSTLAWQEKEGKKSSPSTR